MHEKLLQIMSEVRPDVDFEEENKLITDEILDSYDVLAIIAAIMEEFGVDIPIEYISEENFNSLRAMEVMLQEKFGGGGEQDK